MHKVPKEAETLDDLFHEFAFSQVKPYTLTTLAQAVLEDVPEDDAAT